MDHRDKDILKELSRNARISNAALARVVGLSESSTLDRVRRLEAEGVIQGYSARIEPSAVGRDIEAILHIQLSHHQEEEAERFRQTMLEQEDVLSCFAVAGRVDFIAHVAVANMHAYEQLISQLLRLKAIDRVESMFVLKAIKREASPTPWLPPVARETPEK